eukprot:TRINITY_DN11441_c0_g1_i1.p1 TRINITY_DN11441_c0_g1~~TRINITY_DN11441_c0_g1_i1.p1  ORF type:complete len:1058 (+),score=286.07 TRINITY_DN11441_c0_g1_i1:63-3176(+)
MSVEAVKHQTNSHESDQSFENEFSRLLATLGKEALQRLQASKVLLAGLNGLGAEIAKNIVLMGVASLTVHDPAPVAIADLSSQFFFTEADVGKNRAEASFSKILELNERVKVSVNNEALTEDMLKDFTVVVLADNHSRQEMLRINKFCHENGIAFIAGGVFGLFGWVFNDLGPEFVCIDPNGEAPKDAFVESITKGEKSIITVVDSKRHDLEDGDVIRIEEVQGMTELNGRELRVQVTGPYTLAISEDTSSFGDYVKGGHIVQVKRPVSFTFKPLSEYFSKPVVFEDILIADYSKFDRMSTYQFFTQAILAFQEANQRLPAPGSQADAEEVAKIANTLYQEVRQEGEPESLDESTTNWMKLLAKGASGITSPMATIFGGIIGQEIIKATSSKYSPLKQWLFFDSEECLPSKELTEEDCKPRQTRYDAQIAVFGNEYNEKILNLNYFLVGAGAIGCEVLKCWAMMGLGCGPKGKVDVTDMDTIEISNLNRQFLYRPHDVSCLKSEVSARAVKKMNPAMNIESWTVRVGPETESTYTEEFFGRLDGVCNALDNVQARMYMDSRCVFARKSLLESGTQGTKGNTQVIVPHLTESYASSVDPPATETPVCLLHSFPNNIQHCLQWSRELLFEGFFIQEPEVTNNYISQPGFLDSLTPTKKTPTVTTLQNTILSRPKTFEDCIAWARILFEDKYVCQIQQLLHTFPLDYTDKHGAPFWSGAKRPPTPLKFNPEDPHHINFILSATYLKAYTCGLLDSEFKPSPAELQEKVELIKSYAPTVTVPEFVPKEVKIITDESVTKKEEEYTDEDEIRCQKILSELPTPEAAQSLKMNVIVFDKDDDKNFHIDFIAAAANLRATNYAITPVSRLEAKIIAGKIIPAIVTTTASIVGFVNLELYKLQCGNKKLEDYRNTFINLGLPVFQQSEPIKPKEFEYSKTHKFTLWDRIDIRLGDCTIQEVIDYFEKEHQLSVDMIGVGSSLIYAGWMMSKAKERLPKKLTTVVEEVTGQKLDPNQKFLMIDPTASDLEGNDVDNLPAVCFWFKD